MVEQLSYYCENSSQYSHDLLGNLQKLLSIIKVKENFSKLSANITSNGSTRLNISVNVLLV